MGSIQAWRRYSLYLVYFGPFGHKQTPPHRRPPNKQSARAGGRKHSPRYGASSLGSFTVSRGRGPPTLNKQLANVQFHRVQGPPATDTKQAVWPMPSFTIVQGPPAATTEQAVHHRPFPGQGPRIHHHQMETSKPMPGTNLTQAVLPAWPRPV